MPAEDPARESNPSIASLRGSVNPRRVAVARVREMVKRVNAFAAVLLDDERASDTPLQLLGVG